MVQSSAGSLTRVEPAVYVGQGKTLLADAVSELIEIVVVDHHLRLPDMFEITFIDRAQDVPAQSGLKIGALVTITGTSPAGTGGMLPLIEGEVTSVEADYAAITRTVIRGYSQEHRLQRATRTRAFLNMTDSDIARKIAQEAGFVIGVVEPTRTTHNHVGQVNQTDWEFLSERARLTGYEFDVTAGKFNFRKAASTKTAHQPVELTFPGNLQAFRPRVTAGNLSSETEVRIWDSYAAKVTSAKVPTATGSVALATATADVAKVFDGKQLPAPVAAANPALGDLGPPPTDHGHVRSDLGLATAAAAGPASDEAVGSAAQHMASTFAEAHGECMGDPTVTAGTAVKIAGVAGIFAGTWMLTRTRHVFDRIGYHTHFEVSGSHERSLLGLTSGGTARASTRMPGLVCAIVSNINDPEQKSRVKVTLPWLSPQYESDWSPVVQVGAGGRAGAMFPPEVGDEVLAGFEFGDPQRLYVLGGLINANSKYQLGGNPVLAQGGTASVAWRGIVSSSGNRLAFHDELPPGQGNPPPKASEIVLGTGDASMALAIDQVAGTVQLTCVPAPPGSKATSGHLSIECGNAGVIDIKTGAGGTVNIDGGANLNLKAQAAVKIESTGVVEIKGNPIKLN
jgi:phage protein D